MKIINKESIKKLVGNKFFSAEFIKKNGEKRKMLARLGVKKYLKGGTKGYEYDDLLTVYDMQKKAYRTIPVNRLLSVKANGKTMELK